MCFDTLSGEDASLRNEFPISQWCSNFPTEILSPKLDFNDRRREKKTFWKCLKRLHHSSDPQKEGSFEYKSPPLSASEWCLFDNLCGDILTNLLKLDEIGSTTLPSDSDKWRLKTCVQYSTIINNNAQLARATTMFIISSSSHNKTQERKSRINKNFLALSQPTENPLPA